MTVADPGYPFLCTSPIGRELLTSMKTTSVQVAIAAASKYALQINQNFNPQIELRLKQF